MDRSIFRIVGDDGVCQYHVQRVVKNGVVQYKTFMCKKGSKRKVSRAACPGHPNDYLYDIESDTWTLRQ